MRPHCTWWKKDKGTVCTKPSMCSILPADAEFARSGNRPPKDWACPEHFHLLVNTLSQGGTQPLTFGDWTAIAVFNVSIRLPHSMATPESTPTDD